MSPPLTSIRRTAVIAVVVLLLVVPLGSTVAAAQSFGEDVGTLVVEEGQTVDEIDRVAGMIVVRGTVTGDLSGVAGSIRITETGQVDGNVNATAGSMVVAGNVDGNVRAGAGSFDMLNTGRVGGNLDVGAGYLRVDGTVDGDVRAAGGSVVLDSNANVDGEFRYDAEDFTQSPRAVVEGGVIHDPKLGMDTEEGSESFLPPWFGTVYSVGASLLLGIVLLGIFPRFSTVVSLRIIEDPLPTGGVGLLTLIGVPIALLLVAMTIIGIPLALTGMGLFVLGIWAALVYGKYAVGRWVIGFVDRDNRWLALVVGVVGFAILGLIPVVGGLLDFVVLLLGLGALTLGLRDLYRKRGSAELATTG